MIMKLLHTNNLLIHIFAKNHLELILDYQTRPRSNNIPIQKIVIEVKTSNEPETEQEYVLVQITFTRIYQNNNQKKKFGQSPFFQKVQKVSRFSTTRA